MRTGTAAFLVFSMAVGCGGSDSSEVATPAVDSSIDVSADGASDAIADTSSADSTPPSDTPSDSELTGLGPCAVTKGDATVDGRALHWFSPGCSVPAEGFPAVVFAHGFQLKPNDYDDLLGHVASWGFVVASTDYPGSLFSIDHRDVAKAIVAARQAMVDSKIAGLPKIAQKLVAASGHSLGGKGAVMAALQEPAFAALLTFDPVDGNPGNPLGGTPDAAHPALIPTESAKLVVPSAFFGATQSRCKKPPSFPGAPSSACAPEKLDAAAFDASIPASVPHHLFTLFDFGHMQFLDNPKCGIACDACVAGVSDPSVRRSAMKAIAVAFLRRRLGADLAAQTWLDGAKHDAFVTSGALWDGKSATPACP